MAADGASGAAAGVAGWKLIGGLAGLGAFGAALAFAVVMCLTPPRDNREWTVAIISTVVSSICGGAFVVVHFGLQAWTESLFGLASMFGLVFACGLPGWWIVRLLFNYMHRRRDRDLLEVANEVRGVGP